LNDAKIACSTINAKAETVATSPTLREALKRRRQGCLFCRESVEALYFISLMPLLFESLFQCATASGSQTCFFSSSVSFASHTEVQTVTKHRVQMESVVPSELARWTKELSFGRVMASLRAFGWPNLTGH
jgi:hypothetical protein